MAMTYAEAIIAVSPFITKTNAAIYAGKTDKMLWIEENIMGQAGISASICSPFGERVCEAIEIALEARA
jgi:hypothetical protein